MSDDFDFVRDVLSSCKKKERNYKTFILQDSKTKLYKIAKAEDVEKRFKVLYSSNPNLSIKAVFNDNVKSSILKDLKTTATGKEWMAINDNDIKRITNKYKES